VIEQLGADESPLPSLDHGLGERVPNHRQQDTTSNDTANSNNSNGSGMQVERPKSGEMGVGMQMVNMHNTVGVGLAGYPTEGNVPLLQVCSLPIPVACLGEQSLKINGIGGACGLMQ